MKVVHKALRLLYPTASVRSEWGRFGDYYGGTNSITSPQQTTHQKAVHNQELTVESVDDPLWRKSRADRSSAVIQTLMKMVSLTWGVRLAAYKRRPWNLNGEVLATK